MIDVYAQKYVPRCDMPQVDSGDYDALFAFASEMDVTITKGFVDAKDLSVHQKIDAAKLRNTLDHEAPQLAAQFAAKPCLISLDDGILDGNHRYWVHVWTDTTVPYWKIHLPFEQAIAFLFSFDKTTTIQERL